jgi:integral membrane sensor domain MASE1
VRSCHPAWININIAQLNMTYRFEHQLHGYPIPPRTAEPVTLTTKIASFPAPLYGAGIAALLVTTFIAPRLASRLWPKWFSGNSLGVMGMYVSFIPVLLAIAAMAWKRGELQQWWMYEER